MDISKNTAQTHFENLTQHALDYLDTRWDMVVLNFTERGILIVSRIVTGIFMAFFGGIALIFISIGAAMRIGQQLQNPADAYFIVAGVFVAVLLLAVSVARNYVRTIVTDSVLQSIQDDDDEKTS